MRTFHIVDDVRELCDVMAELIAMAGYRSMQFDSAESHLDYFNSDRFSAPIAILTDYAMFGQTGLQLIRQVRRRLPRQKAVIISNTPCPELGEHIELQLCYSLAKPFRVEQLFTVLKALEQCHHNGDDTTVGGIQAAAGSITPARFRLHCKPGAGSRKPVETATRRPARRF
jgi:DNA-binding NtrC family response regulator